MEAHPAAVSAPRPLVVAYGILAVAASARSAEQLATRAGEAPVAYGLSALSAAVYLVAWQAIRRAPRSSRASRVGRAACSVELIGVLAVGLASLALPQTFAHPTVWSGFGVGYGFAPLVLPVAALWWLRGRGVRTLDTTNDRGARVPADMHGCGPTPGSGGAGALPAGAPAPWIPTPEWRERPAPNTEMLSTELPKETRHGASHRTR